VLAPIVLYVNEYILETRARAEDLSRQLASGRALSATDQEWLRGLAARYELSGSPMDVARMAELLHRVDAVPPSLALAQSASESGWGTSRFAAEGNALFGQWSTGKGIVPAQQRTATHGDHRVAAFESTGMSVWSYTLNLNTHPGYKAFRARRADLRGQGRAVRGADVVDTMVHYSERGQAYVDELRTIMHQNHLAAADDAYLSKMEIIRVVPKARDTRYPQEEPCAILGAIAPLPRRSVSETASPGYFRNERIFLTSFSN